jgi:hypothetical protein
VKRVCGSHRRAKPEEAETRGSSVKKGFLGGVRRFLFGIHVLPLLNLLTVIIDPNNQGSESRPPLDPTKKERYKKRTEAEQVNSILKDWLFPGKLYVEGHIKVSFVLFGAALCLAVLRMIHYFII